MIRRRDFIAQSLALGLSLLPARLLAVKHSVEGDAFSLGIASGDATSRSVILWTRIAPEPMASDGGVGNVVVPVQWELAEDPAMKRVVQRGEQTAVPALAHSVHIDVSNLQPATEYWYRFYIEGQASETGKTRTLPAGDVESARFATASCQNYSHGYFVAYDHLVRDNPDFLIHLGDYIYETSFGETFRQHEMEAAPQTLLEFRRRHAHYKSDSALREAHKSLPFYVIVDNHDAIEDNDPSLYPVRAAAYRAWYEHMPVRGFHLEAPNQMEIHRHLELGSLMQIVALDTRQYRADKYICGDNVQPSFGFGNYQRRCEDMFSEDRSMLGQVQEEWAYRTLQSNQSAWNVLASSGPVMPFRYSTPDGGFYYLGAWDGYPENRKRLVNALESAPVGHPVILSGDVHSFWAVDGERITSPDTKISAPELTTSSISANWPDVLSDPITANLASNPQVAYYNGATRGYLVHEVNKAEWKTHYRGVNDVTNINADITNLKVFRIENGTQGLQDLTP